MKVSKVIVYVLMFVFSQHVSATVFIPADSIGVKTIKGKKCILYKVQQGEGWFGIGHKYGLTVDELQAANEDVKDKPLKPGQVLLVPVVKPAAPTAEAAVQQEPKAIYHKVKKKDTLYSIATKSNVTVTEIKKWNNLKSETLQAGQKLIVGYKEKKDKDNRPVAGSKEPMGAPGLVKETEKKEATADSMLLKEAEKKHAADSTKRTDSLSSKAKSEYKPPVMKGRELEERGIASFIEDEDINPNKYYALHRTAAKGTIIKVTNLMNKKQIYVKVIGTLPNTGDNTDMIIKISKASAMKLGVLDNRFQVILNYFAE